MKPTQNPSINYAITFTTGDNYNKMVVQKWNRKLNNLLYNYKKYFLKLKFNLEILDKELIETKIHYHGYVKVEIKYIEKFQEFVRTWNKDGFIKVKRITDLEKWLKYISKQEFIYDIAYAVRYNFNMNNLIRPKEKNILLQSMFKAKSKRLERLTEGINIDEGNIGSE